MEFFRIKLHTSFSQPDASNEIKPNSRRYLTSPAPLYGPNSYPSSPAERYVAYRSQAMFQGCNRSDFSPETPTSISTHTIQPLEVSMSLAERLANWRQKEVNAIYKKEKYRYAYGVTPPSPTAKPISLPLPFLSMTQPMRRTDFQPSARIVKKDRSTTTVETKSLA